MGIEHPKYKVAVVQAAPAWLDLDASIDKSIALIKEAADKGAQLIAVPEAFTIRPSSRTVKFGARKQIRVPRLTFKRR